MKKQKTMLQIAKEKNKGFSFIDDGKGTTLVRKNRGSNGKNTNRRTSK